MSVQFDRCTKCIQSAAFPKIQFDTGGVCNFCRKEAGTLTADKVIERSKLEIKELLEKRDRNAEYDALMCYSGGKDSTYTLKLAVEKYGLRVMSFTLDNGFISPVAIENINRVVSYLGVDHVTFRPAMDKFKKIVKASALKPIYNPKSLTRISSICNSCISMVNTTALKITLEKRIPFILAGYTIGQIPANGIIYKNNYAFLQESRQASLDRLRVDAGPFIEQYFCLPPHLIESAGEYPTTMNLLCVENITEQQIVDNIAKIGWRSPPDVDGCSSNCRLNTFNNYIHEKVFGYNPYELELSHLIRRGLMTRAEAEEKITSQPQDQLEEIQRDLGISVEEIELASTMYDGLGAQQRT